MNKKRIQQIKCLFTLVFAACTLFHAARSYAQTTQVTISQENVPMERVMNEIEKQTGYLFLSNNDVDIRRNVSVRIENGTLAEALGQMLKGSGVTYRLENKYISLSAAPRGGEPVTVKGTVTDANGPVIGATITIKGGTTGTTSAIDGSFSLSARPGDVLIVAFIGYKSVEIPFTGQTELTVELEEESLQMNAVVVTALGIKREEKALAYNVQQVKAEELTTVKDANFVNSLVGKVAGVTINAGAGGAGSSTRVVMRGQKSIEKSNTALYVIDGIPMYNNSFGGSGGSYGDQVGSESAADINPEDIESVNMLTGPSAAALYGSEAANGVIIINTKRGAVDKTIVTLSNSTMFSSVYMMPEMQNEQLDLQLGFADQRHVRCPRLLQHRNEHHQLGLRIDRQPEEPDLHLRIDDQQYGHHPRERLQPLQLLGPQHHDVRQGAPDVRLRCQLHHPGQQEHGLAGQVLQPPAGALPLPPRR